MDFKDILRLARRRWRTIVGMFVVALAVAGAYSLTATPIYHSQSRVFISTDVSDSQDAYLASVFAAQRVQSYGDLANSRDLMQRVINRLHLDMTPAELSGEITATVPSSTVLIQLEVRDPSPRRAQQIAQVEAEQLTQYVTQLETPRGRTATPIKATIVDPASFDASPVAPRTGLNLAVAGLLGLILGFGLAVLRDVLDTTVKSHDDVEDVLEHPVMAGIGYDPDVPRHPLLTEADAHAARAEAFRVLRTNLQFLDVDADTRSFVITSPVPGEGKTSTTVNLAIALAQTGKRVLVVDGDLRRPQIANLLGVEGAVGLTTVLVGRSTLEESIQVHRASGVHILASGPVPPNPSEILQSQSTRDLLGKLRVMFDVVLIDAPPLLPVADAAIMGTEADGVIMVVRHGKTTRDQLRQASQRLSAVGARLFGAVVNMTPRRLKGYDYADYGYGYAPAHKQAHKQAS